MAAQVKDRLQMLLDAGILCKIFKSVENVRGVCHRISGDVRLFLPSPTGLILFTGKGYWIRYKGREVILESGELEYHSDDDWKLAIAEMKGNTDESGT
jgi:hypothetical protein